MCQADARATRPIPTALTNSPRSVPRQFHHSAVSSFRSCIIPQLHQSAVASFRSCIIPQFHQSAVASFRSCINPLGSVGRARSAAFDSEIFKPPCRQSGQTSFEPTMLQLSDDLDQQRRQSPLGSKRTHRNCCADGVVPLARWCQKGPPADKSFCRGAT